MGDWKDGPQPKEALECPECGGSGYISISDEDGECLRCGGTGLYVPEERESDE